MIGRRGFLGGLVAAAFSPAVAVAAQFTLAAPVMTDEIAASMRRKVIMAMGLNPDMIDSGLTEFSTSRIAVEESRKRLALTNDWLTNPDVDIHGNPKKGIVIEINKLGEFLSVTRAS